MSVDIPRAWEITRTVKPEYHHNKCSYNVAAMLCDCDVLMQHAETIDPNVFYGVNGPIERPAPTNTSKAPPAATNQGEQP